MGDLDRRARQRKWFFVSSRSHPARDSEKRANEDVGAGRCWVESFPLAATGWLRSVPSRGQSCAVLDTEESVVHEGLLRLGRSIQAVSRMRSLAGSSVMPCAVATCRRA